MKKRTFWIVGVLALCVVVVLVLILTRPTEEDRILDFYWETVDMYNNDLETCLATRMPHADPRVLFFIRQNAELAAQNNAASLDIKSVETIEKIADDVWVLMVVAPNYEDMPLIPHFVVRVDGAYQLYVNVDHMTDDVKAMFEYLEYTDPDPNRITTDDMFRLDGE